MEKIKKILTETLELMNELTDKVYDNSKRIDKLEEVKKC